MDPEPDRQWMYRGALGAVGVLYLLHVRSFFHYLNDDAFITLRYSRNLVRGIGPYFNAGEHVEGYTNFLQMVLAAPVIALTGPAAAPLVVKALGGLWGLACLLLAYRLASAWVSDRRAGLVAAGLVAAAPGFAINSVSGLETALYAVTVTGGVVVGLTSDSPRAWLGSGALFGAALLTRPEAAVLFAVYWIVRVVTNPRDLREAKLIPQGFLVTGVFVAHTALRLSLYDGEWLPNTYHAKAGGFWGFDVGGYVVTGIVPSLGGWVGVVVAAVGIALVPKTLRRFAPAVAVGVAGALLPLVTGPDWMMGWRMVVPFVPLLAAVTAAGWVTVLSRVPHRVPAATTVVLIAAVAAVAWLQVDAGSGLRERSQVRARGYVAGHTALADWLAAELDPGDAVALMDIGIVGYRAIDLRILDVTGLTDRHIAKSPGAFLAKQYNPRYVLDQAPEVVVLTLTVDADTDRPPPPNVRPRPWTAMEANLASVPGFAPRYVVLRPDPGPDAGWDARLAAVYGAARVFRHDYPGTHYLLAAYRRQGD